MQFATLEEIKQPVGGLVIEPIEEQDHILGGPIDPEWEVVLPSGDWLDFAWDNPEIQRVQDGDTYWCVTFSHNSNHRFIWKVRYNEDLNESEKFLAIGSGTIRNRGNGKKTVAEWARINGYVLQEDCPTPNTMDECYLPLSKDLLTKGKNNLILVEVKYKYTKDNSIASIKDGLQYSPVQVDVEGQYFTNSKGYIYNTGKAYTHEVIVIADCGDYWAVWDSESYQYLKFDKSYKFGSPMIHSIKKTNILLNIDDMKLIKQKDQPEIYFLDSDNVKHHIKNESIFKAYFGATALNASQWVEVDDVSIYPTGKPFVDGSSLLDLIKLAVATFGSKK